MFREKVLTFAYFLFHQIERTLTLHLTALFHRMRWFWFNRCIGDKFNCNLRNSMRLQYLFANRVSSMSNTKLHSSPISQLHTNFYFFTSSGASAACAVFPGGQFFARVSCNPKNDLSLFNNLICMHFLVHSNSNIMTITQTVYQFSRLYQLTNGRNLVCVNLIASFLLRSFFNEYITWRMISRSRLMKNVWIKKNKC